MAVPFAIAPAQTGDSLQVAAVKLAYWLELAAEALGATGTTDMFKPSMAVNHNDSLQVALVKAAYWAELIYDNGGGGAPGTSGITSAAGAPPTDGSITTLLYKNTSTGEIFVNTGTVAVPVWDPV
jgi:hypothetical protein